MAPTSALDERYALALGELWGGLARVLARLDVIAGEPDELDDDGAAPTLRRLQYALHVASEHAYGLEPPSDARSAHAELAAALAAARDATAEVAEAASIWGAAGGEPLLQEWRGTLFRVRLARLRVAPPLPDRTLPAEPAEGILRPLVAFLLALVGAVAFVVGATTSLWPVWVAGIGCVAASCLVYRP